MCMAYGWQARFVNCTGHEVIEVWNDEFGKWIFMDADYQNIYTYDSESGEPLDMLELHKRYLDYYFPGHTLEWLQDKITCMKLKENPPKSVKPGSLTHHKDQELTGFINAGFMRMIPRNNWYEKPYPRPLAHGHGAFCPFPWGGYICWYDTRTPPKRNHSWHTDRPRDMWPDLNKVVIHANSGVGNNVLTLRFETYTPNFSHFEVDADGTGWEEVGERWKWFLQSGKNTLRARAVSKMGVKGKPSMIVLNHADAPYVYDIK